MRESQICITRLHGIGRRGCGPLKLNALSATADRYHSITFAQSVDMKSASESSRKNIVETKFSSPNKQSVV